MGGGSPGTIPGTTQVGGGEGECMEMRLRTSLVPRPFPIFALLFLKRQKSSKDRAHLKSFIT